MSDYTLEAQLTFKDAGAAAALAKTRAETAGLAAPTQAVTLEYRKLAAQLDIEKQKLAEETAGGRASRAELELRKVRVEELGQKLAVLSQAESKAGDGARQMAQGAKQAGDSAKKMGDDAGGAANGVKKLYDGFQAVIGLAIVQKVGQTTLELAQLGNQSLATSEKFEALSGSVANADNYLRQIRLGTDYTVDKMTAMQSVSKLLSMGLVDNAKSATEFVVMATRLGDVTLSAQDRISDFAALLANQSIPRLDNYSISSGKVKTRIEELQAAFPEMTREAAFNQAVLEQGRIALERLGSAGTGQVQATERLNAAWSDLSATIGEKLAPGLATLAESAALVLTADQRLSDQFTENTEQALAAGRSWEEYARKQLLARVASGEYLDVTSQLEAAMYAQGMSVEEVAALTADYDSTVEYAIKHGIGYNETLSKTTYEAMRLARAYPEMEESQRSWVRTTMHGNQAAAESAAITEKQTAELEKLAAAMARAADTRLAEARSITDANRSEAKAADLQRELETLESKIAAQGPRRVAIVQNKKMSENELASTRANLVVKTEELAAATRKEGESDAEFEARKASLRVKIDELTTATGSHAAAVGGATDAQLKEKDAILQKIAAIELEAQKRLAVQAVEALKPEDFKSVQDYTKAKEALMLSTGLVTTQALAEQEAIGLMTKAYSSGQVDARTYAELLDGVKTAAGDGKVSMDELYKPLLDARLEMARGVKPSQELSGGLGDINKTAVPAASSMNGVASSLGTTREKLDALVKGSPWKISVIVGGGGGTTGGEGGGGSKPPDNIPESVRTSAARGLTGGGLESFAGLVNRPVNNTRVSSTSIIFSPKISVAGGTTFNYEALLWRLRQDLGRIVKRYAA